VVDGIALRPLMASIIEVLPNSSAEAFMFAKNARRVHGSRKFPQACGPGWQRNAGAHNQIIYFFRDAIWQEVGIVSLQWRKDRPYCPAPCEPPAKRNCQGS
jgi:hypothetical protein